MMAHRNRPTSLHGIVVARKNYYWARDCIGGTDVASHSYS